MTDPSPGARLLQLYRESVEPEPAAIDALWKDVADPDAELRILRPVPRTRAARGGSRLVLAGSFAAVAAATLVAWWLGSTGRSAAPTGQRAPSSAPYGDGSSERDGDAVVKTSARARTHPDVAGQLAPARQDPPTPTAGAPPPAAETPSRPHRTPSRAAKLDPLAEETALIRRAEASLRAGNPAGALDVLKEHALEFPSGALTTERKALRAIALCLRGNRIQGRGEAALLRHHAASKPYRERIRRACEDASSFSVPAGKEESRPQR